MFFLLYFQIFKLAVYFNESLIYFDNEKLFNSLNDLYYCNGYKDDKTDFDEVDMLLEVD